MQDVYKRKRSMVTNLPPGVTGVPRVQAKRRLGHITQQVLWRMDDVSRESVVDGVVPMATWAAAFQASRTLRGADLALVSTYALMPRRRAASRASSALTQDSWPRCCIRTSLWQPTRRRAAPGQCCRTSGNHCTQGDSGKG